MEIDFSMLFNSFDSIIIIIQLTLTLILTEISKRKITWLTTEESKLNFKQLTSWIVSIALSFIAWYNHWGIFQDVTWVTTILYGFILGLIANGIFDISIIKSFLVKK